MMHPDTELRYIDDSIGVGVFATKRIPKGTITWALDDLDQTFREDEVAALDDARRKQVLKYSFRNQEGLYILCWDHGRFINHSFRANCVGTAYDIQIAGRDILPGEQLCDDYGILNMDEPFDCFPEEGTDRTRVMPDDLLRYYEVWDAQATEAFRSFGRVAQPLKHLIKPEFAAKLDRVASLGEPIDSVIATYYDRDGRFSSMDPRVRIRELAIAGRPTADR
ncbi:SET domain-containing protein [Paenibacillus sp.]|uniref:SET domain-containing protein n=1 Tax=Paenibacillus sp. TaxID=58172 RepID=UPI002D290D2D|nr:SET domain-containing protein [Paenibacillus sp.]HZG58876.1 SET domain-containing protein [Paenibacillus sp.]